MLDFRRMQIVKRFIPIVALLVSASIGLAQQIPLSAGFVLGGANYLGEIGGKFEPRASLLDADIISTSPTFGAFLRYAQTTAFAFQASSITCTSDRQITMPKIQRAKPET